VISRLRGEVVSRDIDSVEILTPGGVVYQVEVPLSVFQKIPREGSPLELLTVQVVKEDSVSLYGFAETHERTLFKRLLTAKGVGPKLALGLMSTYAAPRLARALAERDVKALSQVSGVGKKTAERIVLELADKMEDLAVSAGVEPGEEQGAQEAVAALTGLGYSFVEADQAVREAIDSGAGATTHRRQRRRARPATGAQG